MRREGGREVERGGGGGSGEGDSLAKEVLNGSSQKRRVLLYDQVDIPQRNIPDVNEVLQRCCSGLRRVWVFKGCGFSKNIKRVLERCLKEV
jgi:hypothetical protein